MELRPAKNSRRLEITHAGQCFNPSVVQLTDDELNDIEISA
jgi:hypothetical protein